MSCILLCRSRQRKDSSRSAGGRQGPPSSTTSSSSSGASPALSRSSAANSRNSDRSGAFPTAAPSSSGSGNKASTSAALARPVLEVGSIARTASQKSSAGLDKVAAVPAGGGGGRRVDIKGQPIAIASKKPMVPPANAPRPRSGRVSDSKSTQKQQPRQKQLRRNSLSSTASSSSSKKSGIVFRSGAKLPAPYNYHNLPHGSNQTIPLNTDYPTGLSINYAAGPLESKLWYARYKSTHGRPEIGRHGTTGYYDFRRLGVEVVKAKKVRRSGTTRNRRVERPMRVGKPVRRSVGLSTLWKWDWPPSWVFATEQDSARAGRGRRVGWIPFDTAGIAGSAASKQQQHEDNGSAVGSVAGSVTGSVAGSVAGSVFSLETMSRPGANVGFGGPFPYDRYLRPEQDPYYGLGSDSSDDDDDDGDDMDRLRFASLPYSFEQSWGEEPFADFDGPRARDAFPDRPANTFASTSSSTEADSPSLPKHQYPTQQLLRPTASQLERARRMHNAARIKARQDRKLSRVGDWRHQAAAIEAEANRRRAIRERKVDIKEIVLRDDASTMSVDVEDISLPGVLQIMAAAEEAKVGTLSYIEENKEALSRSPSASPEKDKSPKALEPNTDEGTIAGGSEAPDQQGEVRRSSDSLAMTDATSDIDGMAYLSDGSTIAHYLQRCQVEEARSQSVSNDSANNESINNESTAELTADGFEEDSREDSTEMQLFLDDEDEECDDSLIFSKASASVDVILAAFSNHAEDEEENRSVSATSTTCQDIVEQSKDARAACEDAEKTIKATESTDNQRASPSPTPSCPQQAVHQGKTAEDQSEEPTREHSRTRRRSDDHRSSSSSVRLGSKTKTWDESSIVSELQAVAKAQGEERLVEAVLKDGEDDTTVGTSEQEHDTSMAEQIVMGRILHEREVTEKDLFNEELFGESTHSVEMRTAENASEEAGEGPVVDEEEAVEKAEKTVIAEEAGDTPESQDQQRPARADESTRTAENETRTVSTEDPASKEDHAPTSATVASATEKRSLSPPRSKIPSPPMPRKKKDMVRLTAARSSGVSLSQHLAATGAKGSGFVKGGCNESIRTMETECSTNPSEDDFVPSPILSSGRKTTNSRQGAQVGAEARSRRRALEAQWSKRSRQTAIEDQFDALEDQWSKQSVPQAANGPSKSAPGKSAQSLEVAILQSLKEKVNDSISDANVDAEVSRSGPPLTEKGNLDADEILQRMRSERNRVASRSRSLRNAVEAAPASQDCSDAVLQRMRNERRRIVARPKSMRKPVDAAPAAPDWNVW